MAAVRRRERLEVTGVVQGVGFRPYVYRLATELGLAGWVLNDERGVVIEVEGDSAAVNEFCARLPAEAPPLAVIDSLSRARKGSDPVLAPSPGAESGEKHARKGSDPLVVCASGFAIVPSSRGGEPSAQVAADSATCADCLRELFDPADRRYRYPFTNCTNCGPRFTIVRDIPYDRPYTTMAGFRMCDACQAEYDDPGDRRFHAQPNACPECGPVLRFVAPGAADGVDPLAAAVGLLRAGGVLALKGIGGYHLACLAASEDAVAALRSRKQREEKPFALMAGSVDDAAALVDLGDVDRAALVDPARPIVIAPRRPDARAAASVAPRSADLGVMLPYSPLHHLLMHDAGEPLVMTSANVSDEPIAFEDADALDRLGGIADAWLVHDRPIATRTDDSVVRAVAAGPPVLMRRSRGYVPRALDLPLEATRPLLAVGAELKSTFCLVKGRRAWVSHHIGDLENWATLSSFRQGVEHFERLFEVAPEVVAHDLHPDYLSTREAMERDGVALVGVQHHHSHLAACLAEHGIEGPAVGAIYDGTGYGTDGTVWGGELLVGDLRGFERAGSLAPVRMPGGDAAVREVWRMACSWVAGRGSRVAGIDPERWDQVAALARSELAPVTSSMGRLFDAVAALAGVRTVVAYEGQAAIELEAAADVGERGAYSLPFSEGVLDGHALIAEVARDVERGVEAPVISARFHNGVARGTADACAEVASAAGLDTVVLSGGVWQNRLLLERTTSLLTDAGLRALRPELLPPGDGGISFGQAAVAAARGHQHGAGGSPDVT